MNVIELREWAIKYNIWEKTEKGFWYCFYNYMEEEKDEFVEYFGDFDKSKLTLWFKGISLSIRNWDELDDRYWCITNHEYNPNYEFIDALIVLNYDDKRNIGEYVMRFEQNGENFDDFLVMDWEKWAIRIKEKAREERDAEVMKASLEQGLSIELISKITGISRKIIAMMKEELQL